MMEILRSVFAGAAGVRQLLAAMDSGRCPVALSGCRRSTGPTCACLGQDAAGRWCGVCRRGEGERLARDLESLTGRRVPVLAPGPTSFTTRPLSPASGSTGGWP
ncbi:MAG: hypothetical protein ACLRWQ_00800 [Flavonifractor plautii]